MEANYIQNEEPNIFEGKKPDNLCRAGCILAIVISSVILAIFGIWSLTGIVLGIVKPNLFALAVGSIVMLIFSAVQIVPIILCSYVLKESTIASCQAGVVAVLFSGLISGILILVGKYEAEKPKIIVTN